MELKRREGESEGEGEGPAVVQLHELLEVVLPLTVTLSVAFLGLLALVLARLKTDNTNLPLTTTEVNGSEKCQSQK